MSRIFKFLYLQPLPTNVIHCFSLASPHSQHTFFSDIYSEIFTQSGNSQVNKQLKNSTPLAKNVLNNGLGQSMKHLENCLKYTEVLYIVLKI